MKKALALALAASLFTAGVATAFTDVDGTLTVTDQTADSVTVLITQTTGAPARMKYTVACHDVSTSPATLAIWKEYRVESGDTVTTFVGTVKKQGQLVTPNSCQLILDLPAGGGAAYELDRIALYL